MLTVTNGFKLYTAEPSSHDYHFQATPSPVTRGITAPFNPGNSPAIMTNDMGESIRVVDYFDTGYDPTAADCVSTSFSFRLLSDPTRVHSLSSAQGSPTYPYTYLPTIDGDWIYGRVYSGAPIKYCVATTTQDGHINADGTVFYTTSAPWVFMVYTDTSWGYDVFVSRDRNLLNWADDMLLLPQSVSQQEYAYTVSGS